MHTRWWHCDDGDFDYCGLRTISRCLPWYHHACPWVGGPIYAANLKAYLIALALLPVYTAVMAVVAIWSLADSSIREASNVVLVISALIPVFNSCYYSWEISSWAWKAAIKHNRLPLSEWDMTIRIRTRNPVTGEHGVEDFMTELHENAFSCCSWRTHFWYILIHTHRPRTMLTVPPLGSTWALHGPSSYFLSRSSISSRCSSRRR